MIVGSWRLSFLLYHLLISSCHALRARPPGKLPLLLEVLYPLDQALLSSLRTWPSHCSPLSCKHSLMLFNFSLVLSLPAEILSSGLMLLIHLTMLTSIPYSLITFIFLFNKSSPALCSITLRIKAEYNLPFVPKGKPLLVHIDTKSLN